MNGHSDSDDESAGMAYFLPIGIADDSPPKRSMLQAGSFGPIGGRTPTASAGSVGGGFHRSNSPSYLHLSSPPAPSPSATTAPLAGSATAVASSSNNNNNNYLLSDLGGEIHQPSGFSSSSTDAASASIGAFGYAIGSFRNGAGRSDDENALRGDSNSIFGRASTSMGTATSGSSASLAGAYASSSSSGGGVASTGSFFNRSQSDMGIASPFMVSAQDSRAFGAVSRNWPPSVSASTATAVSSAPPSSAPANPRRTFQAPPGLGGPSMDSPRLGLSGSDYLGGSRLSSAGDSTGRLHQQSQPQHVNSAFSAFATSASPTVADAFRSGTHPFGSSLSSPLPSLHLTPDVFASSSSSGLQLSSGPRTSGGITNPDLAELNSLSMKMQDAVESSFSRPARELPPASSSASAAAAVASDLQSMPVSDLHARGKRTASPPSGALAARQGDQSSLQQQLGQSTGKRFEKRTLGGLTDTSPQSPSNARDARASPASSSRAEQRPVKPAGTQQQKTVSAASPSTAAPRSTPPAVSEPKSARAKKRGGQVNPAGRSSESPSVSTPTAAGMDADYESSDSTDVGLTSDSWESPNKTSPDARRVQAREKSSARGAKKSAGRAVVQEKAPVASTRRQVYREKAAKDSGAADAGRMQRLPSAELAPSSDELEAPSSAHVSSSTKTESRESKTRPRRSKEAPSVSTTSDVASAAGASKSAGASAPRTLEQTDASDLEVVPKGKRSPKHQNRAGAKASVESKQQASGSSASQSSSAALASEAAKKPANKSTESSSAAHLDSSASGARIAKASGSSDDDAQSTRSAASTAAASPAEERTAVHVKRDAGSPPNEEISPTEPPSQVAQQSASGASSRSPSPATTPDKKQQASAPAVREQQQQHAPAPMRKEKSNSSKRDKAEKKKGKHQQKKEKRDSPPRSKGDSFDVSDISDLDPGSSEALPAAVVARLGVSDAATKLSAAVVSLALYVAGVVRGAASVVSSRLNIRGALSTGLYHLESVAAVVFSVVLLLSLHGASWFIRIHRVAFRAILTHRHIGFCFAFLYAFPFLVQYVFPWAPPWAPVCLWYAFLVQLFCTNGPTAMVTTFRIILPLVFLVEGISHHSFLLDLNGAELLLASFILSAMKTSNLCSPIFFISLAAQCLSAVFLGSELVVQWFQMALALYSLHSMVASEDDWNGFGDDDEELSCQSMSMHHSIADYSHHPSPSAASVQKTKRLDRRALAYVRGRKFR